MTLRRPRRSAGFSLMEIAISIFLIVMVGMTSVMAMRTNLRTLAGSDEAALASAAIRELREFTLLDTIEELDALDGTNMAPVLGDGSPLAGAANMSLVITVQAVDDDDPGVEVDPAASRSRFVDVNCMKDGRLILEAGWLATEH